ncbi:MAG: succinylglutamate desuccinylase/aspartoacylase family protein [Negativicutes bacterium]|nr:succinylglutamate desuccinylase/aspartoacylase family protein [Negativicutes bacterium]
MQFSKKPIGDLVGFELEIYQFGQGDGPKLMVTAGIHGGEVTGTHAANQLIQYLTEHESELKGQVKVLPICNQGGFRRMERTNPYDDLDMNRIFPGKLAASPTLVTANLIYQEAAWPDAIVDLHCCGIYGSNYILSIWHESEKDKNLAAMLDIPVVIQSGGTEGQLFVEASQKLGKAAVIIELAGGQPTGCVDLAAAEEAYLALVKLIKQLGMLPGPVQKPEPVFCGKLEGKSADRNGFFLPAVSQGSWISQGQLIGHLNEKEVIAEADCRILRVGPARYLFCGDSLYTFARKAECNR